jgi:signal peptidase I
MSIKPVNRSTVARVGVAALNVLRPGLGLLRLGYGRLGAVLVVLPFIWVLGLIVIFAVAPTPGFIGIVVFLGVAFGLMLALYIAAIVMTWRRSAVVERPTPLWGRWYSLVLIVVVGSIAGRAAIEVAHRFYKPFYMPGESMAPILGTYDKIIADMRGGRHPVMGDIVLIRSGSTTYVKRVIGLPGQHISMSADVPTINGVPAKVQDAGWANFATTHGSGRAKLFHEILPGTTTAHDILITVPTPYGDYPEQVVPAGMVFVLGDNRERSADSRLPPDEDGLGMVPIAHIVGQPMYVTWSHDHSKIGKVAGR